MYRCSLQVGVDVNVTCSCTNTQHFCHPYFSQFERDYDAAVVISTIVVISFLNLTFYRSPKPRYFRIILTYFSLLEQCPMIDFTSPKPAVQFLSISLQMLFHVSSMTIAM